MKSIFACVKSRVHRTLGYVCTLVYKSVRYTDIVSHHVGVYCWHSILKFGVEVGNDVKRIQRMYNCPVTGCVDLRNLAVRSGMNM